MTWVWRALLLGYWPALTVLLLSPDPWGLLGMTRSPGPPGGVGIHFAAFTLLAALVHAGQWFADGDRPRREQEHVARRDRGPIIVWAVLLLYAVGAEFGQALVPHRDVSLIDLAENLAGLTAGWGVWKTARFLSSARQ